MCTTVHCGDQGEERMKDKRVRKIQTTNLIVIFTSLAIYHFTSEPVIALLNLQEGPVRDWLNSLYIAPFMIAGFWIAEKFNRDR